MSSPPRLQTTGVIAEKLGVPLHRVRSQIKPTAQAGILRLYDTQAVDQIRQELADMDARRRHVRTEVSA